MIKQAILAELSRREQAGETPCNPYQLAKAIKAYPQSIYRMLGRRRAGFKTVHADKMLTALGLCIVKKKAAKK